MSSIWNNLLITPILNLLVFFYQALFGNLILAIVALTLLIRGTLFRLTLPSQKASLKQRELMPQLNALKEKHKGDKKKLAEAQAKLLEEHGINPAAGCLPQRRLSTATDANRCFNCSLSGVYAFSTGGFDPAKPN